MDAGLLPELTAALAGVAVGTAWAPAQVDPTVVVDVSAPVRAIGSFLAVLLVGGSLHVRFEGPLDRAVRDVMDRPRVAVFYGLFAYGLVFFVALYANDILIRVGAIDTPLGYAVVAFLFLGVLAVSGVGFLVVGRIVTEYRAGRRSWLDPVLGALISTVPWLVLPFVPGLLAWIALAAFGVGGRTRTWVHATRSADTG